MGSEEPEPESENESSSTSSSEEWGVGEGVRGLVLDDDPDEGRCLVRAEEPDERRRDLLGRGDAAASDREVEPRLVDRSLFLDSRPLGRRVESMRAWSCAGILAKPLRASSTAVSLSESLRAGGGATGA